jgi:hypothetical protein
MVRHVGLASKPRAGRSQGRSDYQGHAATLELVHFLYDRRGALGLVFCFNNRQHLAQLPPPGDQPRDDGYKE